MKNTVKVLGITAMVAVIGFSMMGCNRGGGSPDAMADSAATTYPDATPAPATTPASAATSVAAAASADPAAITNWDTFLVEYEHFLMKEFAPLANRLNAGDITLMADFQQLQNKFAQWYQRMQVFAFTAGEPTDAQLAKLDDIQDRFSAAMGEE